MPSRYSAPAAPPRVSRTGAGAAPPPSLGRGAGWGAWGGAFPRPSRGGGGGWGLLGDPFREPVAGRVQVVFVAGEAGIGKSRLLHEFRQAIMEVESSATWLEGQCVSFGQSIPFLSVVDLLRKDFAIEEFDGEPEIVFKFRHSDLQTAANLDVRPNTAGDHRIKFKAEALPLNNVLGGFRLLYSHTAEFALREMTSGDRATLGKLSHLFPCLATLRAGHDDRLDLVNQMIVEEVLFDLSRLDFGKGIEAKTNAAL